MQNPTPRVSGFRCYMHHQRGLTHQTRDRKVTVNLTIRSLLPGPGVKIDAIFAVKHETNRAKQYARWLMSSLAGGQIEVEQ